MAVVVVIVTLRIIAMRIAVVVASIATNRCRCRCARTRHLVPIKLSLHPNQLLGKLLILFLQICHLLGQVIDEALLGR